ncbi:MAG: peptide chain release factor N(5)-glutamine methyltransferase [Anaerolineaceae bacterium]
MKLNVWQAMKPAEFSLGDFLRRTSPEITHLVELPQQTLLVLLSYVLEQPQTWILANPEAELSTAQRAELTALVARLKQGEPLPYLTGRQEFFGLSFEVSPVVLIPRPETELLVETALSWLRSHPAANSAVDVGTGSGCIAISLAANTPTLHIVATDISTEALAIAQGNAQFHHVEDRIAFRQADLIPKELGRFDMICANLPYIPTRKLAEVNSLPFEPASALDGGPDGLALIKRCLACAPAHIRAPGMLLFEIEATTGDAGLALACNAFPQAKISLMPDLAGKDRLLTIELEL